MDRDGPVTNAINNSEGIRYILKLVSGISMLTSRLVPVSYVSESDYFYFEFVFSWQKYVKGKEFIPINREPYSNTLSV